MTESRAMMECLSTELLAEVAKAAAKVLSTTERDTSGFILDLAKEAKTTLEEVRERGENWRRRGGSSQVLKLKVSPGGSDKTGHLRIGQAELEMEDFKSTKSEDANKRSLLDLDAKDLVASGIEQVESKTLKLQDFVEQSLIDDADGVAAKLDTLEDRNKKEVVVEMNLKKNVWS
eukprot:CAMPEP_0175087308 /NCGR_PEP_ID=MMETSP0052_2-20121109/29756_1 /TAXON_ID=51329 ORGANISM="Polytomella parva, Strain SAG 63-3" /NCGR_SAMPLE_ID=MMETSP0052_2 /ASSEMBLY_ACC=CAM_ASM_000194 /LENGTH=174 /DNA_ID=CAMNT_0016359635 /DNA_START=321 /DNA_END=842 /DNA_ORIENTATION=+